MTHDFPSSRIGRYSRSAPTAFCHEERGYSSNDGYKSGYKFVHVYNIKKFYICIADLVKMEVNYVPSMFHARYGCRSLYGPRRFCAEGSARMQTVWLQCDLCEPQRSLRKLLWRCICRSEESRSPARLCHCCESGQSVSPPANTVPSTLRSRCRQPKPSRQNKSPSETPTVLDISTPVCLFLILSKSDLVNNTSSSFMHDSINVP